MNRRALRVFSTCLILVLSFALMPPARSARADSAPQSLPLTQDWSNTGMITANNDWSGVPGIIGYRGDDITTVTGADPQTLTADGTSTPINVLANQPNPNTLTTGGVAEFDSIADPGVALQGSGTADAPFILINLNTTGQANITLSYNVRDIDGSADNAVQPVALQYRVGTSGVFVNIPAGFVADVTTGPNLATQVTPVSVVLPADAENQPVVQVRMITANAPGNDEWVSIDDIAVSIGASTGLSGIGAANPATLTAGDTTLLTVTVTPASDPTSTGIGVSADLSSIGGSMNQPFFDDATNGDAVAGDNIFSYLANIPIDTSPGAKVLPATITDAESRTGDTTITLTVNPPGQPAAALVINEIDYDQPSTDTAEFVEIRNNDGASVDLGSYSLEMVNGNGGGAVQYRLFALPAVSLAPGDYFVVCANNSTVANCDLDVTPDTDLIQNGAPDAVAILFNNSVVDAVSYEGNTGAPYTEASGTGLEDPGTTGSINLGISRLPDGADTNQNNVDLSTRCITPGEANSSSNSSCQTDVQPAVTSTNPANGATNVSISNNIDINFSEAVTVSGSWFDISCATSGAHTATVSGGPQNFTLGPDTDFAFSESCTTTIFAANVADQDGTPDNMAANYVFSFTTSAQPFGACGDPATFIHDVQGSGLTSPLNGSSGIILEGVVVGDYQAAGQLGGFHLQEEDSDTDTDSATSEGVWVFNTSFPVNAGDMVRLRGSVTEFSTSGVFLTEIQNLTDLTVCNGGNSVTPTTVNLPVSDLNDWERYEGMLINIPQELTATENFTLARFGEVALSVNGQLLNPTMITTPGPAAIAQQDLNNRSRILLDDGDNQQNIDPTIYPAGGLSASNTLRSGYTVDGLTGVLEQRFGVYRVQPVGAINFNAANPRPAAPEPVPGRLRIVAMNVLNYFTTFDTIPGSNNGPYICGPAASLECRGANNAFEFARQRDKILNAILALDVDVIGLMEVENNSTASLQDLVDGLNAATAPGTYAFINTGTIGGDAIKVALLYRPAKVTPVGAFAILDSTVDPTFIDTSNRPVLAQTFEENLTGERFTVAVNHLKSKGSDCNALGDPDTGDGQGNCNLTRTSAALAEANWLAGDPTGSGDPDFILIGDFNSYLREDPISALLAAGYTNLIDAFVGADAYSYVFDGQSGYLDHALSTSTLTAQVAGVTEWHVNADEPTALDYNEEFKSPNQVVTFYDPAPFRFSDHDPLVVGLNLVPQCNGQNATVYVDHNNKIVGGPLNGHTYHGALTGSIGSDVIVGTDSSDTIVAFGGDDLICAGDGNDSIVGGAGKDTVFGEAGRDTILGGDGLDVLDGGADKDVIEGGLDGDTLTGGDDNDTVLGGPGNDALDGGAGSDICNGGIGTDTSAGCEVHVLIP